MSDTDSIKTDRSVTDLQQKYDKLAMEFAKARMQLNVLKKAYSSKIPKLDHRSIESLEFESCKYDTMSTNSLDLQDFNKLGLVNCNIKGKEGLRYKDVLLLKQDINTINNFIGRVLESTKSNQVDYNLIMTEIEHCKVVKNSIPINPCEILNNELTTLKCSVSSCLYNMLYQKLESRTKINTEDSRLIFPTHYCLDENYKTDKDGFQKVYVTLVLHFFLSFIISLHGVLEYLLGEINPQALSNLLNSFNALKYQLHNNSIILENILIYCDELKTLRFDIQYILMENILLFISIKYVQFVECIKNFIKSDNNTSVQIDCSTLRQNIIPFLALKFPIEELIGLGGNWDSFCINEKLNCVFDAVHILLRAINIMEFEYLYQLSQVDMHWHMKNPLSHIKHSRQARDDLNAPSVIQSSYKNIIQVFNDKLNKEMSKSLSLEQEKNRWENDYKLLCKTHEECIKSKDYNSGTCRTLIVENQLGKCESNMHFNDAVLARETELRNYFEQKMNNMISTNKELSSQNNAYAMEIIALKTQLDHSISEHTNLEIKLQHASEYIEELKDEFSLMSTNYETQLRAMTEHLASLNETVVLERKHIDDLNNQLKIKVDKKKSSK